MIDGAFVVVDVRGVRTVIPVGGLACLMLEPGTRVRHTAVALAARAGTLLIWVGEAGVRLYAAGQPGGARSDRLLYQARLALDDDDARLRVVRCMYARRFGEDAPARRSVDQLRGIEGARVRETYRLLAQRHGASWDGRKYDHRNWSGADTVNCCLSAATSALYGITEAAVLAAGYAPAIGSCTAVSRRASCMISLICSSSRRSCLRRSGWRPRSRRGGTCLTGNRWATPSPLFAAVAATHSGAKARWDS